MTDELFNKLDDEFERLREKFSDDKEFFKYAKYTNMLKIKEMRKQNGNSRMIDLVEHMLFLSQNINQFLQFHEVMMMNCLTKTNKEYKKIVYKIFDPQFRQLKVNQARLNSHLKGKKWKN